MPQPVKFSYRIDFDFSPKALLERPLLAPYIGVISAYWNDIEARLAVFAAAILGGESKTVISVYLALNGDGPKKAALDAITELKLLPADLERFRQIQKKLGKRYSERNAMIHGGWGVSTAYPSDLLWHDTRNATALAPDMIALEGDRAGKEARMLQEQARMLVYNERDFQDIVDRISAAFKELQEFTEPHMERYRH